MHPQLHAQHIPAPAVLPGGVHEFRLKAQDVFYLAFKRVCGWCMSSDEDRLIWLNTFSISYSDSPIMPSPPQFRPWLPRLWVSGGKWLRDRSYMLAELHVWPRCSGERLWRTKLLRFQTFEASLGPFEVSLGVRSPESGTWQGLNSN